jgi:RHS repeat-associated protein
MDGEGNVIGTVAGTSVSQQVSYDPWGTPTISGNADNRLFWKGLLWEGDLVSLYYMRNRWYDPELGRFASEDPIGQAGGDNLYTFGNNDPINTRDPTGTSQCWFESGEYGWYDQDGDHVRAYSFPVCVDNGDGSDEGFDWSGRMRGGSGGDGFASGGGGGGGTVTVPQASPTHQPRDWGACGDVLTGVLAVSVDVFTIGEATEAIGTFRVGERIFDRGLVKFSRNGNFISRNVLRDVVNGIGQRNKGMAGLVAVAREFGQDFQLTAPLVTDASEFIPIVGGLTKIADGASGCYHALLGR